MDVLIDVVLLLWCLVSFLILVVLVQDGSSEVSSIVLASVSSAVTLVLILNNYLADETFEATVHAVSKVDADEKVTVEFSLPVKTQIESSGAILKAYEVAVFPAGTKSLKILSNENNLWRLKFNKREVQLQVQAGTKYKFRVHRLLGRNIIDVETL